MIITPQARVYPIAEDSPSEDDTPERPTYPRFETNMMHAVGHAYLMTSIVESLDVVTRGVGTETIFPRSVSRTRGT